MLRAILDHHDLPVPLDDLSLDLSYLLVDENFVVDIAVDNLIPRLRDALRTQRVRRCCLSAVRVNLRGRTTRFVSSTQSRKGP